MKQSYKILFFIIFLLIKLGCPKHTFSAAATSFSVENELAGKPILGVIPASRQADVFGAAEISGEGRASLDFLRANSPDPDTVPEFSDVFVMCDPENCEVANSWEEMLAIFSTGFTYYSNPQNDQQERQNKAGRQLLEKFIEKSNDRRTSYLEELAGMPMEEALAQALNVCTSGPEEQVKFLTLNLNRPVSNMLNARIALKYMNYKWENYEKYQKMCEVLKAYIVDERFSEADLAKGLGFGAKKFKKSVPLAVNYMVFFVYELAECFPEYLEKSTFLKYVRCMEGGMEMPKIKASRGKIISVLARIFLPLDISVFNEKSSRKNHLKKMVEEDLYIPDNFLKGKKYAAAQFFKVVLKSFTVDDPERFIVETVREKAGDAGEGKFRKIREDIKKANKQKKSKKKGKPGGPVIKFPLPGTLEHAIFEMVCRGFQEIECYATETFSQFEKIEDAYFSEGIDAALDVAEKEVKLKEDKLYLEMQKEEAAAREEYEKAKIESEKIKARRLELEAERLARAEAARVANKAHRQRMEEMRESLEKEAARIAEQEEQEQEARERAGEEERIAEAKREENIQKRILEDNRRACVDRQEVRKAYRAAYLEEHPEEEAGEEEEVGEYTATWPLSLPEISERNKDRARAFFKKHVSVKEVEAFVALHEGVRIEKGKNGVYKVYLVPAGEGAAAEEGGVSYFDMAAFHPPHDGKGWVAVASVKRLKDKLANIGSTPEYWDITTTDDFGPAASSSSASSASSSASASSASSLAVA